MLAQAPAPRNVWDGVYTAPQADRGDTLFAERCATCHGGDMKGGAGVPGLAGLEFLVGWNGLNAWGVMETMKSSMPADNPGGLTDMQYADLLAAIFRGNEFPVSATAPVPTARPELEAIRITRTKP